MYGRIDCIECRIDCLYPISFRTSTPLLVLNMAKSNFDWILTKLCILVCHLNIYMLTFPGDQPAIVLDYFVSMLPGDLQSFHVFLTLVNTYTFLCNVVFFISREIP